VCDSRVGFCADKDGISYGLTQDSLDQVAQDKFPAVDDFDTSAYTMSNGIHHDAMKQKKVMLKYTVSL
jgi:hypothetical protein